MLCIVVNQVTTVYSGPQRFRWFIAQPSIKAAVLYMYRYGLEALAVLKSMCNQIIPCASYPVPTVRSTQTIWLPTLLNTAPSDPEIHPTSPPQMYLLEHPPVCLKMSSHHMAPRTSEMICKTPIWSRCWEQTEPRNRDRLNRNHL